MAGPHGAHVGAGEMVDHGSIHSAGHGKQRPHRRCARPGQVALDRTENTARSAGRAADDGWIKSKIYAQYTADWNTVLDDSDSDIDVTDNAVTLSGTVKSAEAKAKAVATAKSTDGVKSVKNHLRVVRNP